MKNLIIALWNTLKEKGKWSTLMSILLAFPVNMHAVFMYFQNPDFFTTQRLTVLAVLNGIAWFWAIMPSKVTAKWGGGTGELTIED